MSHKSLDLPLLSQVVQVLLHLGVGQGLTSVPAMCFECGLLHTSLRHFIEGLVEFGKGHVDGKENCRQIVIQDLGQFLVAGGPVDIVFFLFEDLRDVLDSPEILIELLRHVDIGLKWYSELDVGEGDVRGVLANRVEHHLLLGKVESSFIAEGLFGPSILDRFRARRLSDNQ